jgi:glycosyltransferase involved in cell wall biosynthesis
VKLSAVIPVRDGERYVEEAIASLRSQARRPDELIVVDDGSTDWSAEIAATTPGVRVLRRAHEGPAAARNAGAEAAAHELLIFLDADDLAVDGGLALQIEAFERDPELTFVVGQMENFLSPERAERLRGTLAFPEGAQPAMMGSGMMVRRQAFLDLGGCDARIAGGEMIDWIDRARKAGGRSFVLPEIVVRRRIHGGNLTLQRGTVERGYLATARAAIERRRREAEARAAEPEPQPGPDAA